MSKISWNEDIVEIDGNSIKLDNPVLEAHEFQNVLLVVTTPSNGIQNNLFGISIATKKIWKVQDYIEIDPAFSQTPYVGITISKDNVIVTDFFGCKFIINPLNGQVIGREASAK